MALLAAGLFSGLGGSGRAGQTPVIATNYWSFSYGYWKATVDYNSSSATPALAPDGTLYAGAFDGTLFALTAEGELKWKFKAGREIHSSAAVGADGTIYFGARDQKLYAVSPAGRLRWTFRTGGWVDSSPAIAADGTVYFGSWDNFFYAVNPDGSLKWKFATGGLVDSSPAIAGDGTVYFGSHDKKFYALAPDGKLRWTILCGGEIHSSPAIGADGTVYFSSLDGELHAVTPAGREQWRAHTGGIGDGSPVLDEAGNIYVSGRSTNFLAGNLGCYGPDGRRRWDWPAYAEPMVPAAAAQGLIYTSRPWNEFQAVTADRQWPWLMQVNDLTSAPVIGADGTVYFAASRRLIALHPPAPAPPAKSAWPMFRANARHTGRAN